MQTQEYTIDAAGKAPGRVAAQAAKVLIGKTSPDYTPNKPGSVRVKITNASKLSITERKALGKMYTRYSGYPGGLTKESLRELIARKGHGEVLRRAIDRMLPRNALKKDRMKRLTIVP